ncbi:DNA-binding transcriptional activator AllS [compost metagenome]
MVRSLLSGSRPINLLFPEEPTDRYEQSGEGPARINKLELLRTFVRVSELSSFTQAADSLSLLHSIVSDRVQASEALLGTRLPQRTT